jgi:hypothetical protein
MPEPTAAEVVRELWFALLPGSLHCISPEMAHCRPALAPRHVRSWRKPTYTGRLAAATALGRSGKVCLAAPRWSARTHDRWASAADRVPRQTRSEAGDSFRALAATYQRAGERAAGESPTGAVRLWIRHAPRVGLHRRRAEWATVV